MPPLDRRRQIGRRRTPAAKTPTAKRPLRRGATKYRVDWWAAGHIIGAP
jgi:hypothetical protein